MKRRLGGGFLLVILIVTMSGSLLAQAPGSDYGPAGWSAGLAQPELSCYQLGLLAASAGLIAFLPGMGEIFGPLAAMLAFMYAGVCG